jgi:hypothetical protein
MEKPQRGFIKTSDIGGTIKCHSHRNWLHNPHFFEFKEILPLHNLRRKTTYFLDKLLKFYYSVQTTKKLCDKKHFNRDISNPQQVNNPLLRKTWSRSTSPCFCFSATTASCVHILALGVIGYRSYSLMLGMLQETKKPTQKRVLKRLIIYPQTRKNAVQKMPNNKYY